MGGGLLQKVNRDTQRFAFKASAVKRAGDQWHDVQKAPLGGKKPSKKGRLKLVTYEGTPDRLQTVFENGELVNETTFDAIRERAAL
jgi:nicotinamide phosphoribosyltransferase